MAPLAGMAFKAAANFVVREALAPEKPEQEHEVDHGGPTPWKPFG